MITMTMIGVSFVFQTDK